MALSGTLRDYPVCLSCHVSNVSHATHARNMSNLGLAPLGWMTYVGHMQPTLDLIPTVEVAGILGRDVRTISRWTKSGRLTPATKLPGKRGAYLFDRHEIIRVREEIERAGAA